MTRPAETPATPPAARGAATPPGRGDGPVRLELPAAHRYLTLVSACVSELLARADGLAEPEVLTYNVQLAAQEICANIVDHAYRDRADGRIVVTLHLDLAGRQLLIDLDDTGAAFDPGGVPTPNLEEGQEHGYGLFLARELLDSVTYERLPSGNHWRLAKHW